MTALFQDLEKFIQRREKGLKSKDGQAEKKVLGLLRSFEKNPEYNKEYVVGMRHRLEKAIS